MKCKRLFALALVLCLALVLGSCGFNPLREAIRGSGYVTASTKLSLDGTSSFAATAEPSLRITGLSFMNPGEIRLVVDESLESAVVVTTDNNINALITAALTDDGSAITVAAAVRNMWFSPTVMIVTVGLPIGALYVDGMWDVSYNCPSVKACRFTGEGGIDGDFTFGDLESLDMRFEGMSDIRLRSTSVKACTVEGEGGFNGDFDFGEMDSLDMRLEGMSNVRMRGEAQRASLRIDGGGTVLAFGLAAQEADITISGMGDCEIAAEQRLSVDIEGSGNVTYAGSPVVSQRIEGLGSVRQRQPTQPSE